MANWIAAGFVSWIFGSFSYFVGVTIFAFLFPRTMQVLVYGVFGPAMWGGATIIAYLFGALFGILPPGQPGFTLAAAITLIPIAMWIHSLARDISTINPNR
jgi:hypothetical protein